MWLVQVELGVGQNNVYERERLESYRYLNRKSAG